VGQGTEQESRRQNGHPSVRVARLPATTDRNPYQALLYGHLEAHGVQLVGSGSLEPGWLRRHRDDVDVLHLHWRLDRLLTRGLDADGDQARWGALRSRVAIARIRARLTLARRLGYRIAWTVHEAARYRPDGAPFDRGVGAALAGDADLLLVHDSVAAERVREWLSPVAPVIVTPVGAYPATAGDASAGRARLGVDTETPLVVAFGHHRADKRLDLVLDAFRRAQTPARLAVVGRIPDRRLERAAREAAVADPRIILDLGTLDEVAVADLHAAADAVVLGRSVDWTPSSLLLALAQATPVIAADLPSHREHLGAGAWWFAPGDVDSLARTLTEVARSRSDERLARGQAGRAHVSARSFDDMAAVTAAALRAACGSASFPATKIPALRLSPR
jgi:glycosyltransferase involved in cell wall biosynthesis